MPLLTISTSVLEYVKGKSIHISRTTNHFSSHHNTMSLGLSSSLSHDMTSNGNPNFVSTSTVITRNTCYNGNHINTPKKCIFNTFVYEHEILRI